MHLILTGATGTVGAPILQHCLGSSRITQLSILARQKFAPPDHMGAGKARIIAHEDYASYPPDVLAQLKGAEACIWAQGTSQNSVSTECAGILIAFFFFSLKCVQGVYSNYALFFCRRCKGIRQPLGDGQVQLRAHLCQGVRP